MKNAASSPSTADSIQHGPPLVPHAPRADTDLPKEKAEEAEVAGRHKNSGPKDHKGAR